MDEARIDITHYRALAPEEIRAAERLVNRIVRENRPVRSYFESRTEAERRFGFTLYQGGMVPGRDLRIVEIEGFDVEACGGTHCTRTGEVGLVTILSTDRIQDGVVRLTYAAGERALDVKEEHDRALREAAHMLGVPVTKVPQGVARIQEELAEVRKAGRKGAQADFTSEADRLLLDAQLTTEQGGVHLTVATLDLDATGLKEVARRLTRQPNHAAILGSSRAGEGFVFVGSSAPSVSAAAVLEAMKPLFAGKGGGNRSAATAVGEPGEALEQALNAGKAHARAPPAR
jgi:alanyl-tRNA synthetase